MEKFVIQGGVPLSGELTAAGNKNAALPILAACLLTEEELLLHRVPRIRDTEAQIALLERLGVEVAWVADNSLRLCAAGVSEVAVDEELSNKIRASFLLAGPLLARFGEARMPPPGGDFIGRRRLDAHLDAFRDLGARVDGDRWIELTAPPGGLRACAIFMDEPSVMGTENALMAAALTPGPTTIAQRRLRAARPGPRPAADQDGRRGRRDRLQRDDRARPRPPRRRRAHDLARPHRGRQLHGAGRGDRRRAADPRRRARRPGHGPPPVPPPRPRVGDRGRRRDRPAGAEPAGPGRRRRRDPEDRGRPLAGLPGRPHLDRARARHPGRGRRS